jgi:hypothetical protein
MSWTGVSHTGSDKRNLSCCHISTQVWVVVQDAESRPARRLAILGAKSVAAGPRWFLWNLLLHHNVHEHNVVLLHPESRC